MTNFVLIPGAWLGAWVWKGVGRSLEKAGHSAFPVTLTGMGDRSHLATFGVGMETAIQDVLNIVQHAELEDYVLVGHSFAGKVAAAVADRVPRPVRSVIYVDAFRPEREPGPQGGFDPTREFGAPSPGANGIPLTEEIVQRIGKDVQGPARRRFLSLASPWPIKMATDPITLTKNYDGIREAYVFCTLSGDPVDEIVAGKWGKLHGPHKVIETGHWPMITAPEELGRDLVALSA